MEIRIDKKYDFAPENDYIKVLCSVIEGGVVAFGNIIAKPRPDFFEADLQKEVGQKYADFLAHEKAMQEKIAFVAKIEEGSTITLDSVEVDKMVEIIKTAQMEKEEEASAVVKGDESVNEIVEESL